MEQTKAKTAKELIAEETFKGTSGPWTISPYNSYVYQGDDVLVICDAFSEHQQVPDQYEREANAELIAAAPEILEICKKLEAQNKELRNALQSVVNYEDRGRKNGEPRISDHWYNICKKALRIRKMDKTIQQLKKRDRFRFNNTVYTVHKKYRNDDSPLISKCGQLFYNEELEVEYLGKKDETT